MEEVKLVEVEKEGRKLSVNPNPDGLKELAKFGWKLVGPLSDFEALVEQCKAKNIKVTAADTAETLAKKLGV